MQGVDGFKSGAYVEGMLPAPRHEGDIMILSCVGHLRPPNLVQIVGKLEQVCPPNKSREIAVLHIYSWSHSDNATLPHVCNQALEQR
jgi:hypothetical protein